MMVFERRTQPPLSRRHFYRRMAVHGRYAALLIGMSLLVGMVGYHSLAGMGWVDSFLNASMLLGGMGPVGDIPTTAGKIFAGVFALYSGLLFLAVAVLLLTPVFHRLMHKFHWEDRTG